MVIINSFKYPESDIKCQQEDVRVYLDKRDLGLGTLFISESTLCWRQREDIGFTIGYQSVSLHAISKDLSVHPRDCVYIMTDGHISMPGDPPEAEKSSDESDTGSAADISEIILIPGNEESISQIYEAIKICQELNPDPMDEEDEDDGISDDNDDNLYEDAEDDMEEGEYEVRERGGGDADIDDLTRRIQANSVDIQINYRNGNDDEDFQDAD